MIAVDAMGGDRAPESILKGAITAAQDGIPILLCGNEQVIVPILDSVCPSWHTLPITIRHSSQIISMHDEPTRSVKKKKILH